ncbi:MAG: hypothetical protein DIJKHBIC_02650 [Thermoanaerobaculia bacterium]|nr:hypothetical protein [Thermoanaerobaculia bacterium]
MRSGTPWRMSAQRTEGAGPRGPTRFRSAVRRSPQVPQQRRLYRATDHGAPVVIRPEAFAPASREPGWGPFAESFLRINETAFAALDLHPELVAAPNAASIRLHPGGRTGAIPLRSGQTGKVVSGFLVEPRFGWAGVGRVLHETGWSSAPNLLRFPLVPGSGREVPPWVLAGPVLSRLEALLRSLRRGYRDREDLLSNPRGRILWARYCQESMPRAQWQKLPCRFPDLGSDPLLRRHVRWALEKVHADLVTAGGRDPVAVSLADLATRLIAIVADCLPLMPRREVLQAELNRPSLSSDALLSGVEALSWIVDERGLGGGREQDGLAWQLPLDELWERWVEALVREEVKHSGGDVFVGRRGETAFPLHWTNPSLRSLGHLLPDIVVRRGRSVRIIDAKYKAHLLEIDEEGWLRMTEERRDGHRADLHQVLAYASLYEAEDVTATLAYPLRIETWKALFESGHHSSTAELLHGGRTLHLEIQGFPFGGLSGLEKALGERPRIFV